MDNKLGKFYPQLLDLFVTHYDSWSNTDRDNVKKENIPVPLKPQIANTIELSKLLIKDITIIAESNSHNADDLNLMYSKYCDEWQGFSNSKIADVFKYHMKMWKDEQRVTSSPKDPMSIFELNIVLTLLVNVLDDEGN